ncbi:hypothetical protein NGUA08_00012 [Salmonella enterica]|nr:hypothetical protein NGUA08_00012 [Salmonella enterica]
MPFLHAHSAPVLPFRCVLLLFFLLTLPLLLGDQLLIFSLFCLLLLPLLPLKFPLAFGGSLFHGRMMMLEPFFIGLLTDISFGFFPRSDGLPVLHFCLLLLLHGGLCLLL